MHDRSGRLVLAMTLCAALIFSGCEGCERTDITDEQVEEPEEEVSVPLKDEVVAVARLLKFSERHFDLRQWRSQAIDAGVMESSGDPSLGLAEMPTAQFRLFLEDLLGEQAGLVQWNGHVDLVVWKPMEDDHKWRWAVSIPRVDGENLSEIVDWEEEGSYATSDEEGAPAETVFRRKGSGSSAGDYFVSESDTAEAVRSQYSARSLVVSNFEEGAVRVPESVAMTGLSGGRDAELFVWPRRWGITDRYRQVAEVMGQQIAMNGHDLLPARVALLQLQTQLYRSLGNPTAWPRMIRVSLSSDRVGGSVGARRADILVDIPTNDSLMLAALWSSTRETNLESGPASRGSVAELGLILRPRDLSTLAAVALPETLLQLMSVRGAGTRRILIEEFDQLLLHSRGSTTVSFYEQSRDLTGEVFVGWTVMDRENMPSAMSRFLTRFMRDYWMPLFDVDEFARRESREEIFAEEEVTIHEMTFAIDSDGVEAGVCWLLRGGEMLSYFGVDPCTSLRDAAELPEQTIASPAMVYSGSVKSLVDKLWILPGDHSASLLEGIDIRIRGQRFARGRIGLSVNFTDLKELARLIDEIPRLKRYWSPGSLFDPELVMMELSLEQSSYQEPGLAAMGAPGMAGVLPTSFLLGMPFSFAPTPPSLFRDIYFESSDADEDLSQQ